MSVGSDQVLDEEDDDVYGDMDVLSDDMALEQSVVDVRKRPYDVEYRCLTIDDIETAQRKEAEHIAGMFMVSTADAAVLLRHFQWNKEKLIERYMDEPDEIKREAGVLDSDSCPRMLDMPDFTCDICFMSADDYGGLISTLSMPCGHRYCKSCYTHYVEQKVREEGESRRIQCMHEKCKLVIDEDTMSQLLSPELMHRYRILLDRTYVDDNPHVRWCPAPDCDMAVECAVTRKQLYTIIPTVRCNCGHAFCFGCGLDGHQPVICAVVRLWLKKCADDSETSNWIGANTKECPKCCSTIEKNGGCNHMTCRKCKYEFCWICSGPWSEHGNNYYNCNRYDEKAGAEARDAQTRSRLSLERYLHYFNRYRNHEQSARLDWKLYLKIEKKMEELQQTTSLTWIEVQFLKKAADTLTECRSTLKWTYCMIYYLQRNNMTELYEDNQRDLERAVEELSGQLESPIEQETIPAMRQKVTDLTAYVHKRREILLTDTIAGYQEDRWQWNVPI